MRAFVITGPGRSAVIDVDRPRAEPGQVVNLGQPVARLAHHGEMEALVALPETALGEARKSDATIQLWSDPGRSFKARLRELSPQADATTRTYAARFTIEEPDDTIALGMTATVKLSHPLTAQVAKLPLSAILNRGTGPSVYLVDQSGALELRPVFEPDDFGKELTPEQEALRARLEQKRNQ